MVFCGDPLLLLAGQSRQASLPMVALNLPAGQAVHEPDAVPVPVMVPSNPMPHSQFCASLDPTGLRELSGQVWQESVDMAFLKLFLAQATH